MNSPNPKLVENPQWTEAPFQESRWDANTGISYAREVSRRIECGQLVIVMKITDCNGNEIGTEEIRFPTTINPEDYSSQ